MHTHTFTLAISCPRSRTEIETALAKADAHCQPTLCTRGGFPYFMFSIPGVSFCHALGKAVLYVQRLGIGASVIGIEGAKEA